VFYDKLVNVVHSKNHPMWTLSLLDASVQIWLNKIKTALNPIPSPEWDIWIHYCMQFCV